MKSILTPLLWSLGMLAAPFAQSAQLDISACVGDLKLQQRAGLTAPAVQDKTGLITAVQATAQGWSVRCAGSGTAGSTHSSSDGSKVNITGVRTNRAMGTGAVATQNMGGSSQSAQGARTETAAVLLVPPGTRLVAKGWTGSLQAEGAWQADVEISSGDMRFGALQDSQIVIDAGSVSVQDVTGRFVGHVRGAGSIEVARLRDAAVDVQLTGAGSIELKGRAATARVRASGAGSVEIEQVTAKPQVTASSLATVQIGRP